MRGAFESLRFFFVSFELLIVVLGLAIHLAYSSSISEFLAGGDVGDDFLKYAVTVPTGLCVWAFSSGRKLLFPEKDKSNAIQAWPDYWKLISAFNAALAWSVIYAVIAVIAAFMGGKPPTSLSVVSLAVCVIGSFICFLTIYNAQTAVEVALSKLKSK